jgi:hypothetical protein
MLHEINIVVISTNGLISLIYTTRKNGNLRLQERLCSESYRLKTTLTGIVNPNLYGQVV